MKYCQDASKNYNVRLAAYTRYFTKKITSKSCIYLFDDFFAELDPKKQKLLILKAKVFTTAIDETVLKGLETLSRKNIY
ncbi:UNVERIFIED_CONTAM: hypothetical protein NCL1_49937 [Trichonephila clavipes]